MRLIGKSNGLLVRIYKKRQILGRIIDSSLSKENASFHKAIIPGLKKGIQQDMRDAFSSTGLAHLLSISGTHFGLLAFIVLVVIRTIIKHFSIKFLTRMTLYVTPTQIAIVLTLPILILYALISGSSTPTVRSLIMVFIYMTALFLGRRGQWLNSLSIAAFIILLWRPGALLELSFQLSFLAVLSIGYVLEHVPQMTDDRTKNNYFKQFINKSFEKVKTTILMTIAAVLGTAPIVAIVFKQFPLISPLTNLIVTPLVCFVILPLGFFTGFIALLFDIQSMPLNGMTDAVTHFALKLIQTFSNIPYSNVHVQNLSFVMIVLYYVSLLFIVKNKVVHPWRFVPFILVVCVYLITPYMTEDNLKITFLDVGQGDASFVELPDKKIMLIDGGLYDTDMGRRVVAPFLWSRGVRSIDYLVLSHPHPDHYGGFIYIMDNFDVGEIWLNGRTSQESGKLFQKIKERKIPGKILRRGDVLETKGYRIYVFHPYDEFHADSPRGEFSNENSDSLVLKIESEDASILFTGDIENEAEDNLVYLGKSLRSDIIKVPHHGGKTSSSKVFIKTLSPKIAVISAGRNNPFKHPHRETLKRYKDAEVKILRTDINGAVTITLKDKSYEINTYQDRRLKKVKSWQDEIRNLGLLF
jgi:competence protein ComEC